MVCVRGPAARPWPCRHRRHRRCLDRSCSGRRPLSLRLALHPCSRYTVTPTVSVLAVMKGRLAGATKGAGKWQWPRR